MRQMKPITATKFTRLHSDEGQGIADLTGEATDLYRHDRAYYVLRGWPAPGRYMTTFWPLTARAAVNKGVPQAQPTVAVAS